MTIHFISTGTKFPYAYYLGVITALKNHKGDVKLWYVEEPDSKYFKTLQENKKLQMEKVGVSFDGFKAMENIDGNLRYVTMFDYLAWKIVSEQGGIIAGLDSITIADWQDLLEDGKEMLIPRDSEAVPHSFTMHGVIVRKGSKLAKQIFKDIQGVMNGKELDGRHKAFKDGRLVFGGAGIIPYLNRVYDNMDKVSVADVGVLGGVNVDHKTKGFYLYQNKDVGEFLSKDVRSIPLYASSSKDFKTIDEDLVKNSNTLLSELIKKMFPTISVTKPEKYRFHVLGLVHLPTSEEYMACAFTQKNVKLCKMLMDMGHEVWLYGAENSTAPCTKFVQTHFLKDVRAAWGDGDNRYEIGYDWMRGQFRHDINEHPKKPVTMQYYSHAITTINKWKRPDDFVVVTQGMYQKPITDAVGLYLTVESGIGYRGSFVQFRSWESSYIQNFTYGSEHPRQSINGRYYDRVIPNYFDTKDFPFVEKKEDYLLFMGRMIQRKDVMTAIKTCQATGDKLILAGQLSNELNIEKIKSYPNVEYVGYADAKKRAELMGKAKAVFTPSEYLEPFCGVHAEAMLCGTPVITTNFGAFTDYVIDGVNGYKCDTLQDFVDATTKVGALDPKKVRESAEQFTLESVSKVYQKWFDDLYQVYLSSQDKNVKGWNYIKTK